jgi:hypothetical protein
MADTHIAHGWSSGSVADWLWPATGSIREQRRDLMSLIHLEQTNPAWGTLPEDDYRRFRLAHVRGRAELCRIAETQRARFHDAVFTVRNVR